MRPSRFLILLLPLAVATGCAPECTPDGPYAFFARRDGAPSTSPSDTRCPRERSGTLTFSAEDERVRVVTEDGLSGDCDFSVTVADELCHVRLPPTCTLCRVDGSCLRFELLVTNSATEELYTGAHMLQNPDENAEACKADYMISFNRSGAP